MSSKDAAIELGVKNAGGKPPALGGPSIRRYRFLYSMRFNGFQMMLYAMWTMWGVRKRVDARPLECALRIKCPIVSSRRAFEHRGGAFSSLFIIAASNELPAVFPWSRNCLLVEIASQLCLAGLLERR